MPAVFSSASAAASAFAGDCVRSSLGSPRAPASLARVGDAVEILDQTRLPFECRTLKITTLAAMAEAIGHMQVRGAPLIGVAAAFGVALALAEENTDAQLNLALQVLGATRPTAVNLAWALARMAARLQALPVAARREAAWVEAETIRAEDVAVCEAIGVHGLAEIEGLLAARIAAAQPLRVMTHCNAGALATLGPGTALAPLYRAHAQGWDLEVLVSETRPRNQGLLTAWELRQAGVRCRFLADNAAGVMMARGEVDLLLVGADRIAANGDVANKVGTYLKALAAQAHGVPFLVAAPLSTMDFSCPDGGSIPIEGRAADELRWVAGLDQAGQPARLRLLDDDLPVANPAFDVTPAALVSAVITEHGACPPNELRARFAPSGS